MRLRSQRVVLPGPLRIAPATVTVEGSRIASIDASASPNGVTHELGEALLAPAFVDAHTHLAMVAFRGLVPSEALEGNVVEDLFFRLETALTPADIRAFTRAGALEAMTHGTGLVFDHYYEGMAVAQGLRDVGLCGVVAPTVQDVAGPGRHDWEAQLECTQSLADAAWLTHGIASALGPHATDTVSVELWRRILDLAHRRDLPLHLHVAQSYDEWQRAHERHGATPVELLERLGALAEVRGLFVHMLFASDADIARLDASRHVLGACPRAQLQFGFPAPFDRWSAAGLPWACGTDAAASNDAIAVQRELAVAASVPGWSIARSPESLAHAEQGTPTTARALEDRRRTLRRDLEARVPALLERAWSVAGRLHPTLRAGAIEPGALANLLIIDLDHPAMWPGVDPLRALVFNDVAPAIDRLMVGGTWHDARSLHESDAARAAVVEARSRFEACVRRAGVALPW